MKKRSHICWMVLGVYLLSGCAGFFQEKPAEVDPAERDIDEARQIALYLGGELRAPEELFDIIYSDMTVIRKYIRDTDFAKIRFRKRWRSGCITMAVDHETNELIRRKRYDAWNDLHGEMGEVEIAHNEHSRIVTVRFAEDLNVRVLIEAYAELPGILGASVCELSAEELYHNKRERKSRKPGYNIYFKMVPGGIEYLFGYRLIEIHGVTRYATKTRKEYLRVYFDGGEVRSQILEQSFVEWEEWI